MATSCRNHYHDLFVHNFNIFFHFIMIEIQSMLRLHKIYLNKNYGTTRIFQKSKYSCKTKTLRCEILNYLKFHNPCEKKNKKKYLPVRLPIKSATAFGPICSKIHQISIFRQIYKTSISRCAAEFSTTIIIVYGSKNIRWIFKFFISFVLKWTSALHFNRS